HRSAYPTLLSFSLVVSEVISGNLILSECALAQLPKAYHRPVVDLHVLDVETARLVERVCDAIVPGSARVRPAVYVDALLARMEDGPRAATIAAFTTVAGGELEDHLR